MRDGINEMVVPRVETARMSSRSSVGAWRLACSHWLYRREPFLPIMNVQRCIAGLAGILRSSRTSELRRPIEGRGTTMLLKRHFEKLLLSPADLEPSREDFEVVGVFNPGAIRAGNEVILLVRVAERPRERRPGFTASPRWVPGEGLTIDWLPNDAIEVLDPRVVKRKADGLVRLTFISHLRVVRCGDGRSVEEVTGVAVPARLGDGGIRRRGPADHGAGRPVLLHLCRRLAARRGDRAWPRRPISATSSGMGSSSAPRTRTWCCSRSRSAGEFVALHRPNAATPFCRPEMWVARSPDLVRWGRHDCLHGGDAEWETGRVGAGTPPVRVDGGWLEIYHGNRQPTRPGEVGRYSTGLSAPGSRQPGADPPPHGRIRSSSRRPTSNATDSCRTSSSPPGSSRPAARTWSTTARPIRARRWWSFPWAKSSALWHDREKRLHRFPRSSEGSHGPLH